MDRTTDEAVRAALRSAYSRAEAERLARRAFHRVEGRRRIVTAAGINVDDLSEHGRRIVDWDESTIDGIVELVAATRAAAEGTAPRVAPDVQAITRTNGDVVAADHPSDGRL
jgi:hypothetical protein